jgi:hypothetical protein
MEDEREDCRVEQRLERLCVARNIGAGLVTRLQQVREDR